MQFGKLVALLEEARGKTPRKEKLLRVPGSEEVPSTEPPNDANMLKAAALQPQL